MSVETTPSYQEDVPDFLEQWGLDENDRHGAVALMWLLFTALAATGRVRSFFTLTGAASFITGANYFLDGLWKAGAVWTADGVLSIVGIAILGWGQKKKKKQKEN